MSEEQARPGVLRRFWTALSDPYNLEEQGRIPGVTMHDLQHPENGESTGSGAQSERLRRATVALTHEDALIPPSDKLLVFRALTGIDGVPLLMIPHHSKRPVSNIGIYQRVVSAEKIMTQRYRFFSILINTCLGIQMVVAASLTALGAASGPHSAVTAFGAINTIMAGILTYLKGSGLPERFKRYQNEWRNIREYIEQREREFCLANCGLDAREEVLIIESMYEGVKREIDATKSGENRLLVAPGQGRRPFSARGQAQGSEYPSRHFEAANPISRPDPVLERH